MFWNCPEQTRSQFLETSLFASLLAVPAFLFVSSVQATTITGGANIAGNVVVTGNSVNFSPTFTSTVGASETGSFAGLTGGTIQSLAGGPVTGNTNVPAFTMFTTGLATPVTFDLTYIAPGVGTLAGCNSSAPGAACTPAGSPFTLFQLTSNTVIASLQLNGVGYTGTSASGTTPVTSIFSTQAALNGTIPTIYQTLVSGGSIAATYSASFQANPTAPVPEPASLLLMGFGLVGAGLVARRKIIG